MPDAGAHADVVSMFGSSLARARGDRWPESTMVGHHYWPDAATLTAPTVNIANVLAIGRTMEDDKAEIIAENGWG